MNELPLPQKPLPEWTKEELIRGMKSVSSRTAFAYLDYAAEMQRRDANQRAAQMLTVTRLAAVAAGLSALAALLSAILPFVAK